MNLIKRRDPFRHLHIEDIVFFNQSAIVKMLKTKTKNQASALNVALAYQGFVDEPVPSVLFDSIESGTAKRLSLSTIAIVALFVGMGISFAYAKVSSSYAPLTPTQLPANMLALSAHNTFAVDLVHPVQVKANDMEHLENWLSYRVDSRVLLAEYNNVGYALVGANIVPDGKHASSMLIYENAKQERVSVFTRYYGGSHDMSNIRSDKGLDLNLLSWQENGAQHTMVSSLELKELRTIFNTHYQ